MITVAAYQGFKSRDRVFVGANAEVGPTSIIERVGHNDLALTRRHAPRSPLGIGRHIGQETQSLFVFLSRNRSETPHILQLDIEPRMIPRKLGMLRHNILAECRNLLVELPLKKHLHAFNRRLDILGTNSQVVPERLVGFGEFSPFTVQGRFQSQQLRQESARLPLRKTVLYHRKGLLDLIKLKERVAALIGCRRNVLGIGKALHELFQHLPRTLPLRLIYVERAEPQQHIRIGLINGAEMSFQNRHRLRPRFAPV